MSQEPIEYAADDEGDPAVAFAQLRGEVALLRRAVERLTAAHDVKFPDYAPTPTRTEQILAVLVERIEMVAHRSALTVSPEDMAAKIVNAAHGARLDDQRLMIQARLALDQATGKIMNRVASARMRGVQNRWLILVGSCGLLAGALFGALIGVLPSGTMSQAWHWPKHGVAWASDGRCGPNARM